MGYREIEPRKIGRISSLHLYPVKGCAGVDLEHANLSRRGLETISPFPVKDREYIIVDALKETSTKCHKFLTQRDRGLQKMTKIKPRLAGQNKIELTWNGHDSVDIPGISEGEEIPVRVHSSIVSGVDQGDQIAKMLSDYLGRPVRLARASGSFARMASQHYVENSNTLSYQDAYSASWLFLESVMELERIAGYAIPPRNFRPNIVGSGGLPGLEHVSYHVRFGNVKGVQPKPCTRCTVPNVDVETGTFMDKRPLPLQLIYANYCWLDKESKKQAIFAENFLPSSEGTINESDDIFSLSERDPPLQTIPL